jgi:hypothetical protein
MRQNFSFMILFQVMEIEVDIRDQDFMPDKKPARGFVIKGQLIIRKGKQKSHGSS